MVETRGGFASGHGAGRTEFRHPGRPKGKASPIMWLQQAKFDQPLSGAEIDAVLDGRLRRQCFSELNKANRRLTEFDRYPKAKLTPPLEEFLANFAVEKYNRAEDAWFAADIEDAVAEAPRLTGLNKNRIDWARRYFTRLEHICRARELAAVRDYKYPKSGAQVGKIIPGVPAAQDIVEQTRRDFVQEEMSSDDQLVVLRFRLAHLERIKYFEMEMRNPGFYYAGGDRSRPADNRNSQEVVNDVIQAFKSYRKESGEAQKAYGPSENYEFFLNRGYRITSRFYDSMLEAQPFDADEVAFRVSQSMYGWWRDYPIGDEQLAITGLAGRSIRSNLRSWREKSALSSNGGKPLSLRSMAELLGTKPVNLSRIETGKRSYLYPSWIEQYAHILKVPELQFLPEVPEIFPQQMSEIEYPAPEVQDGIIVNNHARGEPWSDAPPRDRSRLIHMLDVNQRKFEEATAVHQREMDHMRTLVVRAEKDREEVKFLMASLEAKAEDRERLMEENHRLRQQNEEAFAGHEGQPVRETLPVYGRARAGQFDDILLFNEGSPIDFVGLPYNLVGVEGAFAVMCSGDSMSPKYENGDVLHCHPQKRVRRGHYIVVEWQENEERRATIGRYLTATGGKVTIEKLNPPLNVTLAYRNIFRIVGSTEAED